MPDGTSTETTGSPRGVDHLDRGGRVSPRHAREARSEERVDDDVGAPRLGAKGDARLAGTAQVLQGIATDPRLLGEQEHLDRTACCMEQPGHDEPVAAVGPRATPDRDAARVRVPALDAGRHGLAGSLHQVERGTGVRRLGLPHLLGRIDRLEPARG